LDTKGLFIVLDLSTLDGMETVDFHVGDIVRKLRAKHGWTQAQLAQKTAKTSDDAGARPPIHRNTIRRIENGDEGVSAKILKRVAKALGVTLAQMYALIPQTSEQESQRAVTTATAGRIQRGSPKGQHGGV
jgi:transcriptional regulator with XRE-family HTH domain